MSINVYVQKDGSKLYEVYLNTFDITGKRIQIRRRGFTSMRQAETHEFELKRELANGRDKPLPKTWEDWHQLCIEKMRVQMRPTTIDNYDGRLKKWVNPIWKNLDLSSISPTDVHDLIFKNMAECSEHSKKTILKMVKRVFQMAVEEGLLERNPALPVKVKVPQTQQAVLNAVEVETFLREAKAVNHRFYEVWAAALFTGMRTGELFALKWLDVDFVNKRISVNKSWCSKAGIGPTKNAKNRVVPISGQLEKLLKELKLKNPPDVEHVLPRLKEWENGEQARITREFCKSIGITSIKFHDLRATFITQLLLKGVPLAQVMAVVGHGQLKTTNEYLRLVGSDLDGVTEKLSYSLPNDKLAEVIDLSFRR
jgi:integrase